MVNGSGPDVVEVLTHVRDGLKDAQDNGRSFNGCVVIVVDGTNKWAASTSGLSLGDLKLLLQTARDDAVCGGEGFTVMVPKEEPETPKLVVVQ